MPRPHRAPLVGADTQAFSVGAVTLDVDMARAHGWSEPDVNKAAARLEEISRFYGRRARARYPERYAMDGAYDVFTGIPKERR